MTAFTAATIVVDSARVALFAIGFLLLGIYLVRRWPTTANNRERSRALGMALAMFMIAGSRLTALGQPIEWQFWGSIVVFALVGYSALRTPRRWSE